MSQLAIIISIDAKAAVKNNSLAGNYYMIDNNRLDGSTGHGTENLVTAIEGTQIANWLITGLEIGEPFPMIKEIKGEAVEKGVMCPQVFDSPEENSDGSWWGATVDSVEERKYAYTIEIGFYERDKADPTKFNMITSMDLESHVDVKRGFSNNKRYKEA